MKKIAHITLHSQWDHPIDQGVANNSVVIGLMATAGYGGSDCDPADYTKMTAYMQQVGLRGAAIWAFLQQGSNITIPWYKDDCLAGYFTLCRELGVNNGTGCGQTAPRSGVLALA